MTATPAWDRRPVAEPMKKADVTARVIEPRSIGSLYRHAGSGPFSARRFPWPYAERVVRLIVAIDERRGLADDQGIPWQGNIPTDAQYFRDQTSTGTLVMGYRTYEELSAPLHRGPEFVLGRASRAPLRTGFRLVSQFSEFLAEHDQETVWVIGGAALFSLAIDVADELFITQLDGDFGCTKFFPEFTDRFDLVDTRGDHMEGGIRFRFEVWRAGQG
jgi:dihydrofolate reductase